jgi:CBS domain-containing protein
MVMVRDLIRTKGEQVWHVTPDTTVLKALELMAEKEVGALLVMENKRLAGIISERDFARSIAKTGQCLLGATVDAYMTREIFTIRPDQTIEECMHLMTQKRIRHLPVVEKDELVGLISIGDVVKELIASKESAINELENYIEGRGFGSV